MLQQYRVASLNWITAKNPLKIYQKGEKPMKTAQSDIY